MTVQLIFPPQTDAEACDAAGWLLYHELTAPREQLKWWEYIELVRAVEILQLDGVKWNELVCEWAGRVSCPMKNGA